MMNKLFSFLLLLLLASPVHALTFTTNFESVPGTMITDPNICRLVGQIANGGITATFSSAWTLSRAVTTIPLQDRSCSPFGTMADWTDMVSGSGLPVGLFRNAPSGTKAARICWDCSYTPTPVEITFNRDIHFFSCYLSGSTKWNAWACGSPYLLRFDNSLNGFNVHAISQTDGGLVSGATIELRNASGVLQASISPQLVDGWVGCTTEVPDDVLDYTSVLDPYCAWQYVEIFSAAPIRKVRFNVGGRYFDPLYVDDILAADGKCAHPPCQFEAIIPGMRPSEIIDEKPLRVQRTRAASPRMTIPSR